MHGDAVAELINTPLRKIEKRLFMEILTSNDAESWRRMNETGVLGHFIRAFGKIVSMMRFNISPLHGRRASVALSATAGHRMGSDGLPSPAT
jgi:hypothetical protein